MKILVACEFSGVVRDAFAALGHDAWSCDVLASEAAGNNHIQGDVLTWRAGSRFDYKPLLETGWDLLIAHPPCTYLCNSGVRWLYSQADASNPGDATGRVWNPDRFELMRKACDFFAALYRAPVARVCVENPVMHKYAREYLATVWKVPSYSQTIQPYEHGHGETKRTGLWTRGLPKLTPSHHVTGRTPRVHFESPGELRWKERSRTLPGIAAAMAKQWGCL